MPDFDTVLETVGDYGIYQVVLYILICLPASFPSAFSAFNQVFVAAVPPHWCYVPELQDLDQQLRKDLAIPKIHELKPYEGLVTTYSSCSQFNVSFSDLAKPGINYSAYWANITQVYIIKCQNKWEFDRTTYENTIVTEFELYCQKSQLPVICTVVFYLGSFIGNLLFGYIGDKWGRRTAFFQILATQIIFGTISAFSINIYMFMFLRFIVGMTFPALYQIPFIIGMEFMGPPGRKFAGLVVCIFFGFAMCVLGFVANFIRDWTTLTIISNVPFAILFCYWLFLPESPRWLVIGGKYKEAAKILQNVAKWNKKSVDSAWIQNQCKLIGEDTKQEKYGILDLFRTPNLRRKTIIVTFVWLVNAAVYNGLTYNVSNLGVNDYFAFAINGAVELPAYFIVWPLLNRCGRRWLLTCSMLLGGLACILAIFVPPDERWWMSALAFGGKFCNAASFAILYIFAGELYPTVIRALGMGFSSMIAGMGLILAPYLVYLAIYSRILPLLIMGIFTLMAGMASMFLPETLGAHLPQTVHDAEMFGRHTKFFSCRAYAPVPLRERPEPVGMDRDAEEDSNGSSAEPIIDLKMTNHQRSNEF